MQVVNVLEIDFDTNTVRQLAVKTLIKAVEYTRMNDLRNAWHQLDIIDRDRTKTIVILRCLLDGYQEYKDGNLMDFYEFLMKKVKIKLNKIVKKEIKDFYLSHTYY